MAIYATALSKMTESELRARAPQELVTLLDERKLKLSEIPNVTFKNGKQYMDQIDPEDMDSPIMKGGISDDRIGLIFHVVNRVKEWTIPPRIHAPSPGQKSYTLSLPPISATVMVVQANQDLGGKKPLISQIHSHNYGFGKMRDATCRVFNSDKTEDSVEITRQLLSDDMLNYKLFDEQKSSVRTDRE